MKPSRRVPPARRQQLWAGSGDRRRRSNASWSTARPCGLRRNAFSRPSILGSRRIFSRLPVTLTSLNHLPASPSGPGSRCTSSLRALHGFASKGRMPGTLWFWKLSIYLPLPVFDFAVNLLIRQSWLKQLVSRLKKMSMTVYRCHFTPSVILQRSPAPPSIQIGATSHEYHASSQYRARFFTTESVFWKPPSTRS